MGSAYDCTHDESDIDGGDQPPTPQTPFSDAVPSLSDNDLRLFERIHTRGRRNLRDPRYRDSYTLNRPRSFHSDSSPVLGPMRNTSFDLTGILLERNKDLTNRMAVLEAEVSWFRCVTRRINFNSH
jgi:hypothetical protein